MRGHRAGHLVQAGKVLDPEILVDIEVPAVGLRGVGVGGQKAQLGAVTEADRVAGQPHAKILFSDVDDIGAEHLRLRARGRQEDLRLAGQYRVLQRFKGKVPGRANLAAFEDVADLLGNIQAQVLLVAEKVFIGEGVEVVLGQ